MKLRLAQRLIRKPMWRPPFGWLQAAHNDRDAAALYNALVLDNERRKARGLPTFEPSIELAEKIINKQ